MNETAGISIHKVGCERVDASWSKTVFPYPHHRIYYVTDGEAGMRLSDRNLILRQGRCYLLPAFSLVEATCKHYLSHYYVHFLLDTRYHHYVFNLHQPLREVEIDDPHFTLTLFERIIQTYEQTREFPSMADTLVLQGCIRLLLARFLRGTEMMDVSHARFSEVLLYIDQNLHNPLSNSKLAEIAGLHPSYFSSLFTASLHMSPKQYIIKKRLERAQLLLLNGRKNIKSIAQEVGFENEMYFTRIFRQKVGRTPGEHRRFLSGTGETV